MTTYSATLTLLVVLTVASTDVCLSIYIPSEELKSSRANPVPPSSHHRHVVINYSPTSFFKNDADIRRYLSVYDRQSMLWRCRNAIQPQWSGRPIQFLDLQCEVIGSLNSFRWSHKHKDISDNIWSIGKYKQWVTPHTHDAYVFSAWHDVKMRIHDVTAKDSGVYRFRTIDPYGETEDQQNIYVDVRTSRRRYHRKELNNIAVPVDD